MPLTQAERAFNLPVLKRIVAAAALAGFLAGSLLTGIQQLQVVPIMLEAEVHERGTSTPRAVSDASHDHESWRPADGRERTFFTLASNVVMAVGFALLLGALISLRAKKTSWRSGLLWGLAGYVVFFVAPSLGLPPEVPGIESARLAERQIWWLFAVLGAGAGLWILVFARSFLAKSAGMLLLALPHLIGAPQPQIHGGAAPAELTSAFIHASALANAVFWLLLGSLVGSFYRKLA
jgi:cobalt transporter subunit CbtA